MFHKRKANSVVAFEQIDVDKGNNELKEAEANPSFELEQGQEIKETLPSDENMPRSGEKKCKGCWGFCNCLRMSWRLFKEFSADTSIHGFKYITDDNRHWTERLFWLVSMTLCITTCCYLIADSFRKWQMAPVIVSYSEKFMNVWEIPFGAVTVCPVGGPTPLDYNITDTDKPRITRARYRKNNSSTELFTEVATEEGFCYTFNMLNFNDVFTEKVVFEAFDRLRDNSTVPLTSWELQEGYLTKRPYPYPHRASSSGENGGLKFDIWRKISEVKRSSSHNKGFKLFLHLPCELPQFDKRYYRFPLGKSATIIVSPMMTVTESLKSYDTETRQCYFKKEKELRLFKTYTRPNCQIECLVNYALKICNCVPFSLPRLEGNKTCDSNRSEKCFLEAKSAMIRDNMEISLNTSVLSDDRGKLGTCDCLPACTSLQYDVEISYDDIRSFGPYANIKAIRSAVSIFFKDDDFIFTKRSEMFNSAYVIGSFGGLLGLFMGVSIISLFEIIYFIAFRKQDDT